MTRLPPAPLPRHAFISSREAEFSQKPTAQLSMNSTMVQRRTCSGGCTTARSAWTTDGVGTTSDDR